MEQQQKPPGLGRLLQTNTTKPLPFVDMSRWDATPPPKRQWLVEDYIPLRQPTLLSGEGAIGKSILSLQLLVSTSLGQEWIGFSPVPGPTIYLGGEDEEDEIHRRLAAILAHHNAKFSDLINGKFKTLAYAGKDAVLAELDHRTGRIRPTELFQQLYQEACALKPKAIVIDTVADVFVGDEIKRDQVRQFGSLIRHLAMDSNSAVILAAHPSQSGMKSGSGLSGSTQWHNTVRARAYFKRANTTNDNDGDDDTSDNGQRELQFMKNQYGPLGQCIRLQWSNGLWLPVPPETASAQVNVEDLFIKLLQRFLIQDRDVSPQKSPTYAPALFAKQPEAKAAKVSSTALADAMERLIQMSQVIIVKEGPASRQRSRLGLPIPNAVP